jgi:hypothetical protein
MGVAALSVPPPSEVYAHPRLLIEYPKQKAERSSRAFRFDSKS